MTGLLHDWATRQAERRPEGTAVVSEGQRLTYGELERASSRLASALRRVGVQRGERVTLLLPKGPQAIVAIHGVLKAGGAYVPLDPAGPARRLATILASCEPRVLLVCARTAALLRETWPLLARHPVVGWLDDAPPDRDLPGLAFTASDLAGPPTVAPDAGVSDVDPAYVMYTSGSTGIPKGVVITHRSVRCFVDWAVGYFGTAAGDRRAGHAPLHFDLSVYDVFGSFAAGAELHLVPPGLNLLPQRLAAWIGDSQITEWFSAPSILNYLAKFDALSEPAFPLMRRVLWCGEVFPTPALIYWMRRVPHATFTNLYGPTETTVASSYYTVPACPPDERAAIPIGRPCAGEVLLVLDQSLRPAPPGVVGDLYIGGVGLSPGYWRDEAKTRAAFIADPTGTAPGGRLYRTGDLARIGDDGLIDFVGRVDTQIKSRGHRIELGEIEAALNAEETIQECAVIALRSDGFEGATLCCAYAPRPGGTLKPAEVRRRLAALLPAYMLPSRWLCLDRLPKNANGKTDRRALTELFTQRHETVTA